MRGLRLPTRTCATPKHCSAIRTPLCVSHTHAASPAAQMSMTLCDAHCHIHDDATNERMIAQLQAGKVALMGVREDDFQNVARCAALAPDKVIPCFGVHPWFAHLHAFARPSEPTASVSPSSQKPQQTSVLGLVELAPGNTSPEEFLGPLLHIQPSITWEETLRHYLQSHPHSIVGEFGLDRVACIPGTKRVQTRFEHQLELTKWHLLLAAELGKPVSMHCVRAFGHLQDMCRQSSPDQLPPRIMLHSYGGSPEVVKAFTCIPRVGSRFYFSFSSVINASKGQQEKLIQRMHAVPDDRLLIESDQNTPVNVDSGLQAILGLVCEAKGWSESEAAERTTANFNAFYKESLEVMQAHAAGKQAVA